MMIDARSPDFWQQHPNGCHTYDARGRRIHMVVACNPETGEVIRYQCNGETVATSADGSPRMRHGFWPAPLRVVPVPYRVGDGARKQRDDIPNGGAGIAYLDELIDNAEDGVREQRVDITAAEIIARARAKEQRDDIPSGGAGIAYLDDLIDNVECRE